MMQIIALLLILFWSPRMDPRYRPDTAQTYNQRYAARVSRCIENGRYETARNLIENRPKGLTQKVSVWREMAKRKHEQLQKELATQGALEELLELLR